MPGELLRLADGQGDGWRDGGGTANHARQSAIHALYMCTCTCRCMCLVYAAYFPCIRRSSQRTYVTRTDFISPRTLEEKYVLIRIPTFLRGKRWGRLGNFQDVGINLFQIHQRITGAEREPPSLSFACLPCVACLALLALLFLLCWLALLSECIQSHAL